jgi:transposase
MDQRREFVRLAMLKGANRRELCKQFGIRPDTGYRWLARHVAGDDELADRSRRPWASPRHCSAHIEARVLAVRDANPAWGARKIARCLKRDLAPAAVSTVHLILRRHGRVCSGVPINALRRRCFAFHEEMDCRVKPGNDQV